MENLSRPQVWFITDSQHLYGPGPLKQVARNSQRIVAALNRSARSLLARMAGYAIASIPVIILFMFSMRLFQRGMTEGVNKG